ncbi:MAG: hypothetical protein UW50_C0001G0247 [Candidatus Wolfebacteria bacterium GW2011_GWA1_44_24]|uniref:Uncharacterized protein n=1 Tax=Candidatus Wolfebacteria bacterium GW2011_GWB1_41_12 TaxID=1619006 RepID=A0A0G0XN96_9BACT|nr:MAG: hypothetical protein UU38_C0001G0059 [Candidatus Wolfebacteria bacterium GW2011_GWB1_41_12]KKT56678.1 MAG: hypothetical protein UW50_C0001G0247 [Candidatus Wolfebacteria bacterium GW2011_GWA1_44_24]
MKIAFCLHGLAGGKNDRGEPVDWNEITYPLYKNHILDKNNVDVFIHTWTQGLETELKEFYKPQASIFEKQIMFDEKPTKKHGIYSRWYSLKKSIELKKEHERKNNFIYDWVIIARFDLGFFRDIRFDEFDPFYFYAPNWNGDASSGMSDLWFFSNSDFIDKFSTLYDYLGDYLNHCELSSHALAKYHLEKQNLFGKTKYLFHDPEDFALIREKYHSAGYKVKNLLRKLIIGLFGESFYNFSSNKLKKIVI